ncbi:MAG: pyridoxal-phosphate-dependent aminotransferase family protein [Candidatus Limnocylindria bacterium]
MSEHEMLLIPGPVTVEEDVLAAFSQPIRPHYGADWAELYRRVTARLVELFRTEGDVLLLFGPGMAAVEMAVRSALAPGDHVLVPTNGMFGDRMVQVARAAGLEVRVLRPPTAQPVDPQAIEEALEADPTIRAVGIVHHETIIGLLNPVREICAMAKAHGALTIVDAVSSLGGVDLRVDEWRIDLCASVSNKCLGAPVGVAPLAVSRMAWEAVDDGRPKAAGWYLNLETWRRYEEEWGAWHPHPTTMPTSAIQALGVAVDRILAMGLETFQEHQATAARHVRTALREMGFEMLIPDEIASPVTTAVLARPGMDVVHYTDWLRTRRRLRIAGGIGDLAGKIFRVGHMGKAADSAVVDDYLEATAEYLTEAGLS